MYCYEKFIGTLTLFLIFVFVFCCCLFVCFTFFKGIDGRFSGPLTAVITEILVYVKNMLITRKSPSPSCFAVVS